MPRRLAAGAAIAAALAASGCGGSGGDRSSDRSDPGAADPGAAGAEADAPVAAFCEEYTGYEERFNGGASHAEVLEAIRALDPPPELEGDFVTLAGALEALATVDTSDPEAVAEFQAGPSAAAQEANVHVLDYVAGECPARTTMPQAGNGEAVPSAPDS